MLMYHVQLGDQIGLPILEITGTDSDPDSKSEIASTYKQSNWVLACFVYRGLESNVSTQAESETTLNFNESSNQVFSYSTHYYVTRWHTLLYVHHVTTIMLSKLIFWLQQIQSLWKSCELLYAESWTIIMSQKLIFWIQHSQFLSKSCKSCYKI